MEEFILKKVDPNGESSVRFFDVKEKMEIYIDHFRSFVTIVKEYCEKYRIHMSLEAHVQSNGSYKAILIVNKTDKVNGKGSTKKKAKEVASQKYVEQILKNNNEIDSIGQLDEMNLLDVYDPNLNYVEELVNYSRQSKNSRAQFTTQSNGIDSYYSICSFKGTEVKGLGHSKKTSKNHSAFQMLKKIRDNREYENQLIRQKLQSQKKDSKKRSSQNTKKEVSCEIIEMEIDDKSIKKKLKTQNNDEYHQTKANKEKTNELIKHIDLKLKQKNQQILYILSETENNQETLKQAQDILIPIKDIISEKQEIPSSQQEIIQLNQELLEEQQEILQDKLEQQGDTQNLTEQIDSEINEITEIIQQKEQEIQEEDTIDIQITINENQIDQRQCCEQVTQINTPLQLDNQQNQIDIEQNYLCVTRSLYTKESYCEGDSLQLILQKFFQTSSIEQGYYEQMGNIIEMISLNSNQYFQSNFLEIRIVGSLFYKIISKDNQIGDLAIQYNPDHYKQIDIMKNIRNLFQEFIVHQYYNYIILKKDIYELKIYVEPVKNGQLSLDFHHWIYMDIFQQRILESEEIKSLFMAVRKLRSYYQINVNVCILDTLILWVTKDLNYISPQQNFIELLQICAFEDIQGIKMNSFYTNLMEIHKQMIKDNQVELNKLSTVCLQILDEKNFQFLKQNIQ